MSGAQSSDSPRDMMTLQRWLDWYVSAWRSYDPVEIRALFSEDAVYLTHPYDPPIRGRQAIVDAWLEDRDDPTSWECEYRALALTGDVGIGTGWTRYRATSEVPAREYRNIFVLRFAPDGSCKEFTEWFVTPRAG